MFKNRGMYNRTKMARLSESNEEVNENSLEMFSQEDTAFQKPLTNSRGNFFIFFTWSKFSLFRSQA